MNKQISMFKKFTLKNNLRGKISLRGGFIIDIMDKSITEERKDVFEKLRNYIDVKIREAEHEEFTAEWGGKSQDKVLFAKLKQDVLIEVSEDLEKYGKKNKLV